MKRKNMCTSFLPLTLFTHRSFFCSYSYYYIKASSPFVTIKCGQYKLEGAAVLPGKTKTEREGAAGQI